MQLKQAFDLTLANRVCRKVAKAVPAPKPLATYEDVYQEAMAHCITLWDQFDATRDTKQGFGCWLYVKVRNATRDTIKREYRIESLRQRPFPLGRDELHDWFATLLQFRAEAASRHQQDDTARDVRDAVAGLPAALESVVRLHYFEGLTQAEVAARLGCSQPFVSKQIHQALKKLREVF